MFKQQADTEVGHLDLQTDGVDQSLRGDEGQDQGKTGQFLIY